MSLVMNDTFSHAVFDSLLRRVEENERGYLRHETGYQMTDAQLATLNQALNLTKDKTYRPYCVANGCKTMPRMALRPFGFECPHCANAIGFDLKRLNHFVYDPFPPV